MPELNQHTCYIVRRAAFNAPWPFPDMECVKGFFTGRYKELPANGGKMAELNLGEGFGLWLFRPGVIQKA